MVHELTGVCLGVARRPQSRPIAMCSRKRALHKVFSQVLITREQVRRAQQRGHARTKESNSLAKPFTNP